MEKLSAVEFGTWFLFLANRPRKEQWEAKLAWSNPRTQHYMFVNRLGQQVAVKSGAELVADIRAGDTRILQAKTSTPFFERALERIAEQLRRTQRR
jgi:protoporphyrinogen oxidase